MLAEVGCQDCHAVQSRKLAPAKIEFQLPENHFMSLAKLAATASRAREIPVKLVVT